MRKLTNPLLRGGPTAFWARKIWSRRTERGCGPHLFIHSRPGQACWALPWKKPSQFTCGSLPLLPLFFQAEQSLLATGSCFVLHHQTCSPPSLHFFLSHLRQLLIAAPFFGACFYGPGYQRRSRNISSSLRIPLNPPPTRRLFFSVDSLALKWGGLGGGGLG